MAFILEDGSRVSGSNALASVAFCDSYHADRDHAIWPDLDLAKKQACIIRATDYLQKRFSRRWKGQKISFTQSLDWPRMNVWDDARLLLCQSNQIPTKLQQAVAEYALRCAIVGELAPDPMPFVPAQDLSNPDYVPPTEFEGGRVRRVLEKVDVLEESKTYESPDTMLASSRNKQTLSNIATDALIPEYPAADLLLEDYMRSGASRRIARG